MRDHQQELVGLTQLHQVGSVEQVRSLWRRGMATLAAAAADQVPVPLEGLNPVALVAGVRAALQYGLIDDMGWLAPQAAGVAMFELASALPRSMEKRELGRRVLVTLRTGNAETFVALATSLALGSRRGLDGDLIRARVALSLQLPIGVAGQVDALALALISRRDLAQIWLTAPSVGSLPARRLAARLLERAAREAARRDLSGDDGGTRVFRTSAVQDAWHRQLNDRESLVWRHAAAARGLLFRAMPELAEAAEYDLSPDLSPTEWRRASASFSASLAGAPDVAMGRCRVVLEQLVGKDAGVPGAMALGLPCAVDTEPEAAEELLESIIGRGGLYAVESLVDIRRERFRGGFGQRAAVTAQQFLEQMPVDGDDGLVGLRACLHSELAPESSEVLLRDLLVTALERFGEGDNGAASLVAEQALEAAHRHLADLEEASGDNTESRVAAFTALRELDRGLFETTTLADLLEVSGGARSLEYIFDRVNAWLLSQESAPVRYGAVEHPTWRLRRLRTLLHLVDADGNLVNLDPGASGSIGSNIGRRRSSTAAVLLQRVSQDASSPLHRTLCATLARTCDALVREELYELSDVLLALGTSAQTEEDFHVLAEACMVAELEQAMVAFAATSRALSAGIDLAGCVTALEGLARTLPPASSARVEALRRGLMRMARASRAIITAGSLRELAGDNEQAALEVLASGVQAIAQLTSGARRRTQLAVDREYPTCGLAVRAVAAAVNRAASDGDRTELEQSISAAVEAIAAELPLTLSEIASQALLRLPLLPDRAQRTRRHDALPKEAVVVDERLASWLPPGRIMGGFFIKRAIGRGAGGSVFVACRSEDRRHSSPELFALKVPEYSGAAAHTLSEEEFNRLFREEAGALLALPAHPNIAGFVTFDVGARPKPILVMELVEGPTLEHLLDRSEIDLPRVFSILDGVAAGLSSIHAVGVAHLDVKLSNIVLRARDGTVTPVLVDFGLAGRKVRPGCATVHFGSPEVWSTAPLPPGMPPMPTDVYAFCCMAFELLTGHILFEADTAVAVITSHISHDGWPPALRAMAELPGLRELTELLSGGLRHAHSDRTPISELRRQLRELAPSVIGRPWPLG